MPAVTRGSAKKQSKNEDTEATTAKAIKVETNKSSQPDSSAKSRKRNFNAVEDASSADQDAKKKRQSLAGTDEHVVDAITINRAPVLELWGASVAHLTHPELGWETCLSIGAAISTITAISKGRSIGKISKADPEAQDEKKRQREKRAEQDGLKEVEVMSFVLQLNQSGYVFVGEKAKKPNEAALSKKYGEGEYTATRDAFINALKSWSDEIAELNSRAFSMYEDFRPTVPPGQTG